MGKLRRPRTEPLAQGHMARKAENAGPWALETALLTTFAASQYEEQGGRGWGRPGSSAEPRPRGPSRGRRARGGGSGTHLGAVHRLLRPAELQPDARRQRFFGPERAQHRQAHAKQALDAAAAPLQQRRLLRGRRELVQHRPGRHGGRGLPRRRRGPAAPTPPQRAAATREPVRRRRPSRPPRPRPRPAAFPQA